VEQVHARTRPQGLTRFGHTVIVTPVRDPDTRLLVFFIEWDPVCDALLRVLLSYREDVDASERWLRERPATVGDAGSSSWLREDVEITRSVQQASVLVDCLHLSTRFDEAGIVDVLTAKRASLGRWLHALLPQGEKRRRPHTSGVLPGAIRWDPLVRKRRPCRHLRASSCRTPIPTLTLTRRSLIRASTPRRPVGSCARPSRSGPSSSV
jgi:hypothetical protein